MKTIKGPAIFLAQFAGDAAPFKDAVGKTQCEERLHDLFAEKMIDAVDILFIKAAGNGGVECARRCQIVPKGLFDNEAHPAARGGVVSMAGKFRVT